MRRNERKGHGGVPSKAALEEQPNGGALPVTVGAPGGRGDLPVASPAAHGARRSTESEVYDDGTNTFFWIIAGYAWIWHVKTQWQDFTGLFDLNFLHVLQKVVHYMCFALVGVARPELADEILGLVWLNPSRLPPGFPGSVLPLAAELSVMQGQTDESHSAWLGQEEGGDELAEMHVTLEQPKRSYEASQASEAQVQVSAVLGSDSGSEASEEDEQESLYASASWLGVVRGRGPRHGEDTLEATPGRSDGWTELLKRFILNQQAMLNLLASQRQVKVEEAWHKKTFPKYEVGADVGIFLNLFEATCQTYRVPYSEYVTVLWSQVSGELARLLSELTQRTERDYNTFRDITLKRFGKTEHQLRQQFRQAFPRPGIAST
uniref:Uncharacterized protein n=1 Tax=Sphaerodactylus townsendi TaxID=933632 RepID=A0ACB8G3M3_9SAUR